MYNIPLKNIIFIVLIIEILQEAINKNGIMVYLQLVIYYNLNKDMNIYQYKNVKEYIKQWNWIINKIEK